MISNKFLKIKEADNNGTPYYYAERLGKDSVAFILYDRESGRVGLIKEYKPPIEEYLYTAFGGSMDKEGATPFEIMKDELREEAGYELAAPTYVGSSFVSTQMNQFCYLYFCDVTGIPQNKDIEENAEIVWLTIEDVVRGRDWKAITILTKMGLAKCTIY